jgi:putative CocE/NonD family hydrolase
MIGCSYPGDVQILTAKTRHPALKALIPQSAGSSIGGAGGRYYQFATVKGGVAELAGGVGWFVGNGSKLFLRRPASWSREQWLPYADRFTPGPMPVKKGYQAFYSTMPVVDIMERIGAPPNDFNQLLLHGPTDLWWRQFGYLTGDEQFDVPALHINSWYDYGVAETLLEFELFRTNAVSEQARNNQFTVIGPTAHCRSEFVAEETVVGARPVGDARFDHRGLYVQWFDHWLKGMDNGVTAKPKVQIYVMGRNQWRAEHEWPLARTKWTRMYLHSAGRANGSSGDGMLSIVPPKNETADEFTYDPAAPVPSRGGPVCCTIDADSPEGSYDQRPVEVRHDVLVYSTPPLEQGIEVTGPLKLVLFVSSRGTGRA